MTGGTICVTVNGEEQAVAAGINLQELLEALDEPYRVAVVELNHKFVDQDALPRILLQDGDDVEVMLLAFGG
ncbi:MAG: sulfur carrier protein ThiS [Pseudomonadota bacterium]